MADHAGVRSRRLGRQPEAVPDRRRVAVPHEGPERADERCLREGLRRGEGARCARRARPARQTRRLPPSSGSSLRSLSGTRSPGSWRPGSSSTRPTRLASTRRSTWPRRTPSSPAGTTSTTTASGVPGPPSARRTRTATRRRSPTRTGSRCSPPATATTPPLGTPPFPDHPSGHGCLSGAVLQTHGRLLRQGQGRVHRCPRAAR